MRRLLEDTRAGGVGAGCGPGGGVRVSEGVTSVRRRVGHSKWQGHYARRGRQILPHSIKSGGSAAFTGRGAVTQVEYSRRIGQQPDFASAGKKTRFGSR